jgi:hypothetical protein
MALGIPTSSPNWENVSALLEEANLAVDVLRTILSNKSYNKDQLKYFGSEENLIEILELLGIEFLNDGALDIEAREIDSVIRLFMTSIGLEEAEEKSGTRGFGLNPQALKKIFEGIEDYDEGDDWFLQ